MRRLRQRLLCDTALENREPARMFLKMNCDLILIKSVNSNSHLNRRAAVAHENARSRRAPMLRGAHKTSWNGSPEKADQLK